MIRLFILIAFSSVSAFVRDEFAPRLHPVTERNDEQETRAGCKEMVVREREKHLRMLGAVGENLRIP